MKKIYKKLLQAASLLALIVCVAYLLPVIIRYADRNFYYYIKSGAGFLACFLFGLILSIDQWKAGKGVRFDFFYVALEVLLLFAVTAHILFSYDSNVFMILSCALGFFLHKCFQVKPAAAE